MSDSKIDDVKINHFLIRKCISGICECICVCGSIRFLSKSNLEKNRYKSCGCKSNPYRKEYLENFQSYFWEKVKKEEMGCWIWKGNKRNGYGRIGYQGRLHTCHRLTWKWKYGEIPKGKILCHKCDNPSCVNPDHLFIGNHKDNLEDCKKKGRRRIRKGEANANSKLKNFQIIEIRGMLSRKISTRKISEKFDVSKTTISKIAKNENWSHIQ